MTFTSNLSLDEIHELEAKFYEANPGTEAIITKWMQDVSNKVTGPILASADSLDGDFLLQFDYNEVHVLVWTTHTKNQPLFLDINLDYATHWNLAEEHGGTKRWMYEEAFDEDEEPKKEFLLWVTSLVDIRLPEHKKYLALSNDEQRDIADAHLLTR